MSAKEFVGGLLAAQLQRANRLRPSDREALLKQMAELPALAGAPRFSILMPVYEPPREWFAAAIGSVREQLYPNWQLCIADDKSPSPWVREFIAEVAAKDDRISFTFRDDNGHISAASNSALALADGAFLAMMDNDDELSPLALLHAAIFTIKNPQTEIFYTDEDKIDMRGRRFGPYRKPDWNPDLFHSHNFLSHLTFFRTDLIRSLGGFSPEFDGSQDYELALRATSASRTSVGHIPHVTYHWRALPTSTASGIAAKGYAADAGRRAVAAQLGSTASVVERDGPSAFNGYRVDPIAPGSTSVVLRVNRRGEMIESLPDAEETAGKTLIFVEDGARLPQSAAWRELLSAHLARDGVGAVGGAVMDSHGRIVDGALWLGLRFRGRRHAARVAWRGQRREEPGANGRAHLIQAVSAVSVSFMAVRSEVFHGATGFSRELGTYADVDLCLRLGQQELRTLWLPELVITAKGQLRRPADARRLTRRHAEARREDGNVAPSMSRLTRRYHPRRRDDALGIKAVKNDLRGLATPGSNFRQARERISRR